MFRRLPLILIGSLAAAALMLAACSPASDSDDSDDSSSSSATSGAATTAVQEIKESSSGTQQKEAPKEDASAGPTSVSGIPLDPDAKYGGILQLFDDGEGPSNSIWEEAAGSGFFTMQPLHSSLIRPQSWGGLEDYQNNAFFNFHPDLAESWQGSEDGKTWTFKLRDGLEWSDGTPLTSADVKWSYDTIITGEGLNRSPRAVQFLAVDSVTTPDDLTVVFNLKYPKAAILEVIGMPYHIIRPKHVYEGNTEPMRKEIPDVIQGPFQIDEWIPGEKYVFSKRDDYWNQPLPYLDGLNLNMLSRSAAPIALRGGRVDIAWAHGFTGAQAETLINECDVCNVWPRVIASSQSPSLMLNHQRAPWNDPKVKEAFALAIDNQKYVTTVRQDWYFVPTGCGFYPTSEWAMPAERCAQIPGYGDFQEGGTPEADKEKAKALLADAGYEPGDLKVNVYFWSAIQGDAPAILEDLNAIGVAAEAEVLETARAYATWSDGNFDIGVHSFWVAGIDPDITLYEHFYTGSDRNYNRYSNPEFDALTDKMSKTVDKQARKELAWDAMELALSEQAKIIVSHSSYVPVHNKKVHGLMPTLNYLAGYGPHIRYDHTWIDEENERVLGG